MLVVMAVLAAVLIAGTAAYLRLAQPAETQEATLQTAVVRQGDLIISATGSGTLTAPEEELGFTGSGEMTVTGVYVSAGELVQKGEVLAEVDSRQAELEYADAQRAYADLTSTTAQAAALRQVADTQAKLQSAKWHLEYLIGPDVMYWETEIAEGQETLKAAEAQLEQTPSDEQAKKAVSKAEAFLDLAEDRLSDAWEEYYDEYVPMTFGIAEDLDVDTYNVPSELEVTKARTAIDEAEKQLQDSRELYDVLMGAPMPDDTLNESLNGIKQAQRLLEESRANLEGSKITAPFSGTVMAVNAAGGDTVEVSSTDADTLSAEGVVVLADTNQPYLEVFWDESDWSLLKVGNEVEITFDDRPDKVFTGKITEIDRELYISYNSTTIRGEVSLGSPFAELSLPVGASASVEVISQRAEGAILIPIEALHETTVGNYMVFVLEDGKVRLRAIEVGLKDQTYAQITSGLEAGEVVTTGLVKAE